MMLKGPSSYKAIALLLVFSFLQLYVVFALAGPSLSTETAMPPKPPQAITARLMTRGNQPILVNGNNARTGATILSGATVETGDQVGATINLGSLGSIDIAPNTKALIEFSAGQIKVTIIYGCAIVRNRKDTYAQLYTDKGLAASNDAARKQAAVLDICYPSGAPAPIVNQGAAANAGAGAGGGAVAGSGLPPAAWAAILLGGGAAIAVPVALHRGRNPSPGTPRGAP